MSVPVLDSANNGNSSTSATSLSWTHTCSGSDRYLRVSIFFNGAHSNVSVTYNGVSMSLVDSVTDGTRVFYTYELVAPATGANTVSITWTTTRAVLGTSVSYTNVDQGSPRGTVEKVSSTSSPTSVDVSLNSSDLGVSGFAVHNSDNNVVPSASPNGTALTTQTYQGGSSAARQRDAEITGSGTTTITYTSTGVQRFLIAYPLHGISTETRRPQLAAILGL